MWDSYLIARDLNLIGVADGMGGHKGGKVASRMLVAIVDAFVRAADADHNDSVVLTAALEHAHGSIRAASACDPELEDMGTTASMIRLRGRDITVAHVGDSRIYRVRDEQITLLTEDHSLVFQQLKAGILTAEQAERSPFRNVILRCVGARPEMEPDVFRVGVRSGDTFLLCSDGLSNLVNDHEMLHSVNHNRLHNVPDRMIDLANERGGTDNITVVVAIAV
jgi:PPM family protein phosphatase